MIEHNQKLNDQIRQFTQDYMTEAFANGKSAYGWVPCLDKLEKDHPEIFSDEANTQYYGILFQKRIIFDVFRAKITVIRDARQESTY